MSKRSYEQQLGPNSPPSAPAATSVFAEEGPANTNDATISAAASASAPLTASSTIEPLPEQSLGRKRPRHSSRTFGWLSILAPVEVQLVLRCLDSRSRLIAARCSKQLYAAANHSFAWPQEQMATLRVEHDVMALQLLGQRVRRSLLRLSSIRLYVVLPAAIPGPLRSELFAVPNVQSIKVQSSSTSELIGSDFFLPMLLHPAAQRLRSLDITGF